MTPHFSAVPSPGNIEPPYRAKERPPIFLSSHGAPHSAKKGHRLRKIGRREILTHFSVATSVVRLNDCGL